MNVKKQSKERILITGSNGLLGQKLVNILAGANRYKIVATSRGENRNVNKQNYVYYNLDITNASALKQIIYKEKPQCIINCAAMTHVDVCEKEQSACYAINVSAVKELVKIAKEKDIHLIHISTDFIFDGKSGPYDEEATPNPVNYYGKTKLESEQVINGQLEKYSILRTILLYGAVQGLNRPNIVFFVKNSLEQGKEITMVDDQYRMPTLVDMLANACVAAYKNKAYGVFNVSSNKLLNVYEMALEISQTFNLDNSLIKKISTSELNQPAKRPHTTGFILDKSQKYLNLPLQSFSENLQTFKNQIEKLKTT